MEKPRRSVPVKELYRVYYERPVMTHVLLAEHADHATNMLLDRFPDAKVYGVEPYETFREDKVAERAALHRDTIGQTLAEKPYLLPPDLPVKEVNPYAEVGRLLAALEAVTKERDDARAALAAIAEPGVKEAVTKAIVEAAGALARQALLESVTVPGASQARILELERELAAAHARPVIDGSAGR
jgi:hypothetical protein